MVEVVRSEGWSRFSRGLVCYGVPGKGAGLLGVQIK